jgi:hypothetical protein
MTILILIPAMLSLLVLGAHFFRAGSLICGRGVHGGYRAVTDSQALVTPHGTTAANPRDDRVAARRPTSSSASAPLTAYLGRAFRLSSGPSLDSRRSRALLLNIRPMRRESSLR